MKRLLTGLAVVAVLTACIHAPSNTGSVTTAIAALRGMGVTISDNRNWQGNAPEERAHYGVFIPSPSHGADLDAALELLNTPGLRENLYELAVSVGKRTTLSVRSVRNFPRLRNLSVSYTSLTDVDELRRLRNLRELRFFDVELDDLNAVSRARQVTILELESMRLSSLAPLKQMDSLRTLELWSVELADWPSLGLLSQLTEVKLYMAGQEALSALSGLNRLSSVSLDRVFARDAGPVLRLPALTRFSIRRSNLDGLSAILETNTLRSIEIGNDTAPFAVGALCQRLPALTEIRLPAGFAVSDLTDFAPCELRVLEIGEPSFTNLAPLAEQTALEQLILGQPYGSTTSRLMAQDLRPLAQLVNLRDLRLRGANVSDFNPLRALANIDTLDISYTRADDIDFISSLHRLRRFFLSGTAVSDLAPLGACERLQILDIAHLQVRDIRPVAECLDLRRLDVTGDAIQDFAPIEGLPLLSDFIGRR